MSSSFTNLFRAVRSVLLKKNNKSLSLKAVLVVLVMMCGVRGWGQVLLTDDFTGTVGTSLTANGWVLHSGSGTPFLVSSPGLTYTSYTGSGIGNAASTGGTSDDVNKAFTSTNSGSLYMSFMYKPTSASTTTDYPVHFGTIAGTAGTFFGKFYVQRDASSNLRFGITKTTAASANYTGYTYALNTTYLIVIRYDFVSGANNDVAYLFVNPILGTTEPTPTVTMSTDAAADPAQLTAVCLRQNSTTAGAVYDGFKVGKTWADITPLSTLTPPSLTAAIGATVDAPFNVTFTEDATWRAAITSITVDGTPLTAGSSATSAGQITFTPSASTPAALLQSSGTKNIVVIANGYSDATVSQTIGAGADNKLAMNVQPTDPPSNGAALATQPSVFIQDQYGNATASTATVTATTGSGAWVPGGNITANGVAGTATFSGLTATSAVAVTGATINFTSPGLTAVESAAFDIPAPPGLTPPVLTAASGATVDANFDITYTDDALWRAAVTTVKYGTTVLSPGTDYSLAAGILTLMPAGNAALQVAGAETVTVSAVGYDDATVNQTIGAGTDNKLAMSVQPTAPATNGAVLATQPSVIIQDQYGNTTASTATVTANTGSGAWTPGGNTTANAVAGTAAFSGLTAGSAVAVTGATIDFTSPGLTPVTSATFNIPAPPADHIAFVSVPSDGISNFFLGTFTVEARRPDNSVDNTYNSNIVISKATGSGTLLGNVTRTAVAGVATFNDLQFSAADSYTLNANSGSFSEITSGTIVVTDPIAKWSFDAVTVSGNATTPTISSAVAETGSQTAGSLFTGLHASSTTAWTTSAGNGSLKSFAADRWAIGDYFQFKIDASGYYSLSLKWDQRSSNTGPRDFKIQYSTDGTSFTDFTPYSVANNAGVSISWSAGSVTTATALSFDLSSITALNGASNVFVRLVVNSGTAINGSGIATGGTSNVDNFTFIGTPMPVFYPRTTATDLNQVSDWTDDVTGVSGISPTDFTSANQIFNISRNPTVLGAWSVSGGSKVTLNTSPLEFGPLSRLTVGAGSEVDFNSNSVILRSTAAGTASIGNISGTLTDADNVTVERYIPANATRAWRLLAIPTTGSQTIKQAWQENQSAGATTPAGFGTQITANAASWSADGFDFQSPGNSMLTYVPAVGPGSYVGVSATSDAIASANGYMLFVRGDRTALPSNTDITSTVLRTTGGLKQGLVTSAAVPNGEYAMIGNPYASQIGLTQITVGSNIPETFYVWDPLLLGNNNVGGFQTISRDGVTNNYNVTPNGTTNYPNGVEANMTIESGQAFFVLSAGNTNNTIAFNESSKTTGSRIVNIVSTTGEQLSTKLYRVNSGVASLADGTLNIYNNDYANAVDNNDGVKMPNFNMNLGTMRAGKKLAIERKQVIGLTDTVYYNLTGAAQQNYRFEFEANALDHPNLLGKLVDNYLSQETIINLNGTTTVDFTINADAGSSAADRFKVVFFQASALPVTITSVKAAQQGSNILVEWKASNQYNMKEYQVEKSTDGINFSEVNTQAANGTNGSDAMYNWLDVHAVVGTNGYRIRSIGIGGDIKVTQVVIVKIGKGAPAITIYPNPVTNRTFAVQFADMEKGLYNLMLINTVGQVMFTQAVNHSGGSATQTVVLSAGFAKGMYQLVILKPDNTKTTKALNIAD